MENPARREDDVTLPPDLTRELACPACRGPLRAESGPDALTCSACRLRFGVEDGIPNMLIEDATPTDGGGRRSVERPGRER